MATAIDNPSPVECVERLFDARQQVGDDEPMAPDEITLTPFGAAVMARMKASAGDAQPEDDDEGPLSEGHRVVLPFDVETPVTEILNMSRAMELAISGCEIPSLDRAALDALAFTITQMLDNLRAKLEAEAARRKKLSAVKNLPTN